MERASRVLANALTAKKETIVFIFLFIASIALIWFSCEDYPNRLTSEISGQDLFSVLWFHFSCGNLRILTNFSKSIVQNLNHKYITIYFGFYAERQTSKELVIRSTFLQCKVLIQHILKVSRINPKTESHIFTPLSKAKYLMGCVTVAPMTTAYTASEIIMFYFLVSSCNDDYVMFHEENQENPKKLCGNEIPEPFNASTNELKISFQSGERVGRPKPGFVATYTSGATPGACQVILTERLETIGAVALGNCLCNVSRSV